MTTAVDTTDAKNALAQKQAGTGGPTLFELIKAQAPSIEAALPRVGITPERFIRTVQTEIRRTPRLASCTSASILGAMIYGAQLGLEPGPLGLIYLVPYGNEATFILGYKGMIELARRSGEIIQLEVREVCENDEFAFDLGDAPFVRHNWNIRKDRGEVVAFYGLAVFKNGGKFILPVSLDEIEARKNRSRAKDSGPWKTDPVAMARKTVVRMMVPWLPLSAVEAEAFATDESVREFRPGAEDVIRVKQVPEAEPVAIEAASEPIGEGPQGPDIEPHEYWEHEDGTCAMCKKDASDPIHIESPGAAAADSDGVQGEAADPGEPLEGDPQVPVVDSDKHGYDNWPRSDLETEFKARGFAFSGKKMAELVAELRADDKLKGKQVTDEPPLRPF